MLRRSTLVALPAAAALALTACGGSTDQPSAPGAGDAAAGDAFPVTLEHIWGETVVEERPERVVALGVTDADPLLGLGVVPVAVTPFVFYADTGVGPWAQNLLGDAEPVVFTDAEVDVEAVAALAPDLVVAVSAGFDEAVYDQLSRIAPTIVRPAGTVAYGVDRDTATRVIARAVGEVDRGEELIAAADQAFADALAEHPEFQGATGTAALYSAGVYYAFLPADARGRALGELGFVLPDAVTEQDPGDSFFLELSAERLDVLDADVLVVLTDPESVATVQGDALLAQVPVVAAGGLVVNADDVRGAMSYNSVLSAPFLAEDLSPLLAAALAATDA